MHYEDLYRALRARCLVHPSEIDNRSGEPVLDLLLALAEHRNCGEHNPARQLAEARASWAV